MKVEITISGLVVIALKSTDDNPKPEHPDAVEIIVPDAHHHTCRWSYLPDEVLPAANNNELADLMVDHKGRRVASLPLQDRVLQFELAGNSAKQHTVHWGSDAEKPATSAEEPWLNWLPKIEQLGFPSFAVGPTGTLTKGARARITLPPGVLASRNLITDRLTNDFILWHFPAAKKGERATHALANEVVFTATGDKLSIIENGQESRSATLGQKDTLQMCISHETTQVPRDYNDPSKLLAHLKHFDVLTGDSARFQEPQVSAQTRTGKPICMGVVLVHRGA